MKNLLLNFSIWRERLRNEPLAIFLDYDGTLTAIAPTPSEAKLSLATQEILKALVRLTNVKVAVISGRALNELRKIIPVKGLSFVGSHGVEFRVNGVASRQVSKKYLRALQTLNTRLKSELGHVTGILFEEKPYSLAIHYRNVSSYSHERVIGVVCNCCNDSVYKGQIAIISGKKVVEIMPPNALNKGQAVKRLLRMWGKRNYLPIYIGDDRTDESAFEALYGRGLTAKVGLLGGQSRAGYYLDSVETVRTFLRMMIYLRDAHV